MLRELIMMAIMNIMRVTKATREAHREALLHQAGRLFRARGLEAVRVADITAAAGLTHGGFYGHFLSKEALAAEICRSHLLASAEIWKRRAGRARGKNMDPLDDLVRRYLTEAHRDRPEDGCTLAALGPEIARAGPDLSGALADGTKALLEALLLIIAEARPNLPASRRSGAASAILAAMTGGIVLARALAADPEASRTALDDAIGAALAVTA
jgi:TetR/AcrR family transcriptional repressor of nem operon